MICYQANTQNHQRMRNKNQRYNVPRNDQRACLCRDGSYSRECCNPDDYFAQGIGSVTQTHFILYTEQLQRIVQENGHKLFQ